MKELIYTGNFPGAPGRGGSVGGYRVHVGLRLTVKNEEAERLLRAGFELYEEPKAKTKKEPVEDIDDSNNSGGIL